MGQFDLFVKDLKTEAFIALKTAVAAREKRFQETKINAAERHFIHAGDITYAIACLKDRTGLPYEEARTIINYRAKGL